MDGASEKKRDVKVIARVFAPFKYDNDTRCDLHPRWNRAGDKICFDSIFEGHRGLYVVDVKSESTYTKTKKIRVCFMMTACKKSGPVQQMLNIIKNLDHEFFEPVLLTIYDEPDDGSSQLELYLPYVKHYHASTSKIDILTGRIGKLKETLDSIQPDVIHSLGVFPDYAISRLRKYPQIITLRNYVWDDYPTKFGIVQGSVLAELHLYAMKHTSKTVACSKSLSKIYKKKLNLNYGFIRNGVDVEQYTRPTDSEATEIREELEIPTNAFVYVYSGQVIDRKNQRFLLEVFRNSFKSDNVYLLLLGDGADYQSLYDEFGSIRNIDFRGNVSNVEHYLKACDAYVSTSRSEGMPNGVLEAMASGLPVVLSDIEQHNEVMEADDRIGYTYKQGDQADLANKMKMLVDGDHKAMGDVAYKVAHESFSASGMSKQYQKYYRKLARR